MASFVNVSSGTTHFDPANVTGHTTSDRITSNCWLLDTKFSVSSFNVFSYGNDVQFTLMPVSFSNSGDSVRAAA